MAAQLSGASSGTWIGTPHVQQGSLLRPAMRIHRSHRRRMQPVFNVMAKEVVAEGTSTTREGVSVLVEKTSWNSRRLLASVSIQAPVETVWRCLTDYEGLSSFIPSLVENRCIKEKENGAVVYQVGAQDVAMGVKFSAACTLDCTEYPEGVPESLCSCEGTGSDGLLPYPKHSLTGVPAKDITFYLVEGDFNAFRGVWRMQPLEAGMMQDSQASADSGDDSTYGSAGPGTMLCYALYVQPQAWLPVGIIQNRIEAEVLRNLDAVRKHAEGLGKQQSDSSSASSLSSSSS